MYPIDRRKLAVHVYSLFQSLRKTALILQVSHSTISRWIKNPERKRYCRSGISKTSLLIQMLKTAITSNPFVSLASLQKMVFEMFKFTVSKELLRSAIASINYSKKNAKFFGEPKNLQDKVLQFTSKRNDYISKGYNFFSLDETSFGRNTKNIKGYAPKGQQLKLCKHTPRITTLSYIAVASKHRIIGKMKTVKSFNTTKMLEFLKSITFPSNSVLLLDNVAFHHSNVIKEFANEQNLILLYTPPYSPWFNPIEGIFSIVKRHYYKSGDIEESFDRVTTSHCQSFFADSFRKN